MQFYKVTGTVADEKWAEENNDCRVFQPRVRRIALKSNEFNQLQNGRSYYFISGIGNNEVTAGIIDSDTDDRTKQILEFFKSVEIDVKDFDIDEITFSSTRSLLCNAENNDYISNEDVVLKKFELDRICGYYGGGIEYGENLLNGVTCKEKLFAKSDELLATETLTPELERIYSEKTDSKAIGHPVHYMIETDDRDTRKALSQTLLQALFENNRLQGRRYCFIDFKPGQEFSKLAYDVLYKSCAGGAILVRYLANDDSEDDEYASSEFETILNPGSVTLISAYSREGESGGFTSYYGSSFLGSAERHQSHILGALGGMAALEQKFGIVDTGASRDLDQAFRSTWNLVTEDCICGFHLHSNSFDDSVDLKAKQELTTAAEIERFYRKTKEILSGNSELLEAIAKELSDKGVLTASDIQRVKSNCRCVYISIV